MSKAHHPVAALALILFLAGCAAPSPVALPTGRNLVGTCKNKTTAEEMISVSDVSPAVDCNSPHTLETYAVTTAAASIRSLGPERPGPEILSAPAANTCPLNPIRSYLGASDLDSQWGLSVFVKFPTRSEWAGGLRNVVCDLVVATASTTERPQLTTSLRNIMHFTDSARVRLCRVGNDDTHLLTCDLPHTSERVSDTGVVVTPTSTVDGAHLDCQALAQQYVGATLLPPSLTVAITLVPNAPLECWVTNTEGKTTGTVRGGLVTR